MHSLDVMDLSCGSVSSDELDGGISSSTEAGSTRRLLNGERRHDLNEMHSQDSRTGDGGKPLTPAQELRKVR